jgi:hypothetical protein
MVHPPVRGVTDRKKKDTTKYSATDSPGAIGVEHNRISAM